MIDCLINCYNKSEDVDVDVDDDESKARTHDGQQFRKAAKTVFPSSSLIS